MKFKVFVDGSEGTTGLQINERLAVRNDLYILKIDAEKRKDINERKSVSTKLIWFFFACRIWLQQKQYH